MKAIEINIKITIPKEVVESEKIKLEEAYTEFINPLRESLGEGIVLEGEAHEI